MGTLESFIKRHVIAFGVASISFSLLFMPFAVSGKTMGDALEIWPPLLVTADSLVDHLSDPNLVVLDARPVEEYNAGHIRGAINLPMLLTYSQEGPRGRIGPIHYIQALFSSHGIGNDTPVVIYGDKSFIDAARVLWTLEVYGHERVGVLDVSYGEWVDMDYSHDLVAVMPTPKRFIATLKPEKMWTKLSVRLALNKDNKVLIDTRTSLEYEGQESRTSRYGYIPSAITIPTERNLTMQNGHARIKSLDELAQVYGGLDKNKKIVTYCNMGKRASVNYLALRLLGYDTAQYDGSWIEWSSDPKMPIARVQ